VCDAQALGKDAATEAASMLAQKEIAIGKSMGAADDVWQFEDPKWANGTWDLEQFKGADGETDWDMVIDAEVRRRKVLQAKPEASTLDEVVFDTGIIPWQVWMRRFHLPEAESVNGRAAMIGFAAAWFLDCTTGFGLKELMASGIGQFAFFATVSGIALVRRLEDLETLKALVSEATFYDNQWNETWKDAPRPSETEQ